jgi:hypothetical protein
MTKEMYDSLLKRYSDAKISASMEQDRQGEHFTLLDTAVAPKNPIAPDRILLALLSFALSAGLAAGAVIVAERLDTSFHSVDDLKTFTSVPVVAGIPRLPGPGRRRGRMALAGLALVVGVGVLAGGSYWVAKDSEFLARTLARAN